MNIRKPTDYTTLFTALDAAVAAQLPQMELYCEIGRVVSGRGEKGAAVAASQLVEKVRFGLTPRRAFAFPKEKIAAPTENPLKELLCVSSSERDFFSSISR